MSALIMPTSCVCVSPLFTFEAFRFVSVGVFRHSASERFTVAVGFING